MPNVDSQNAVMFSAMKSGEILGYALSLIEEIDDTKAKAYAVASGGVAFTSRDEDDIVQKRMFEVIEGTLSTAHAENSLQTALSELLKREQLAC